METIKYHTVGTILKSYRKIIERDKIDTSTAKIHDHSLSWLDTDTSIKLVSWAQTSTLTEMMTSHSPDLIQALQ